MKFLVSSVAIVVALLSCTSTADDQFLDPEFVAPNLKVGIERDARLASQEAAAASYCHHWSGEGHCGACTGEWGCGFCPSTNECLLGNATGPIHGRTCAGDWNWANSQCNHTTNHRCYAYHNCDSCIDDSECGWCGVTGKCGRGNQAGPSDGSCPTDSHHLNWHWSYCPQCGLIDNCLDCNLDPQCGWCNNTAGGGLCTEGNHTGPYRHHYDVPSTCRASMGTWKYNESNSCTSANDECQGLFSCSMCTETAECGWCETTRTCRKGHDSGPTGGFCPTGAWHWIGCPSCWDAPTCGACTDRQECGWCNSTEICLSGNSSGPFAAYCPNYGWTYVPNACSANVDPCRHLHTCGECTLSTGCGWCDLNKKCKSGNYNGPASGFCPSLYWSWDEMSCTHCAQARNCSECIVRQDCGWCNTTNRCEIGNASTAFGRYGRCPHTKWSWWTCPAPRHHHHHNTPAPTQSPRHFCYDNWNCSSCTRNPECGWCYGLQECLPGNMYGSNVSWYMCPRNEWGYESYQCKHCGQYTTCGDCTSEDCGWCDYGNYGYCMYGNATMPYGYYCPANKWGWYSAACTVEDCTYQRNCANCTSAPSGNCGWCYTTGRCSSGSSSGPSVGSCPAAFDRSAWAWVVRDCVDCNTRTSCSDCTNQQFCGWCSSSNRCMDGNTTGPLGHFHYCPSWKWHSGYESCPAPRADCRHFSSMGCQQCVNSPSGSCGWCSTSKLCESGTYSGPTRGTCPSGKWEWYSEECVDSVNDEMEKLA